MSPSIHAANSAPGANTRGPGRREQHREDTRSRLIAAARALFMRKGFDSTSMEEIAERAGVSRRTCFRYFPSKEELAFPHRERRLQLFGALIRQSPPGESAYEAVKRACLVMAGEYMNERAEVVVLERLTLRHPLLRARERENDRHWENAIVGALARDSRIELARILGGAVMGAVRAALEIWIDADGKPNLVELGQQAFGLLDHGARTLLVAPRG
jgi:AcrR family transcriptional regulator